MLAIVLVLSSTYLLLALFITEILIEACQISSDTCALSDRHKVILIEVPIERPERRLIAPN